MWVKQERQLGKLPKHHKLTPKVAEVKGHSPLVGFFGKKANFYDFLLEKELLFWSYLRNCKGRRARTTIVFGDFFECRTPRNRA